MAFTQTTLDEIDEAIVALARNPYRSVTLNGRSFESADMNQLLALRKTMVAEVSGTTTSTARKQTIIRQTEG